MSEEYLEEIEVLESIFGEQLTIEDKVVELNAETDDEKYNIKMRITYTDTYPEELPLLSLEQEEGDLDDEELAEILEKTNERAEESIGMAMVYTLYEGLKEDLMDLVKRRKERIAKEEAEKSRIEEELERKKFTGTRVTKDNFLAWREQFEQEMELKKKKELEERLSMMPQKEREQYAKLLAKPTGRQLFEEEKLKEEDLSDSEDILDVDIKQFQRHGLNDDEEESE